LNRRPELAGLPGETPAAMQEHAQRDTTHIVSLGGSCRLAYNLRLYFKFTQAWPFDWFVAPLESVALMLADPDPVAKLYDPQYLEPVTRNGGSGIVNVRNTAFRIGMNHDFMRSGGFVTPDFLDYLEKPRERQTHLFGKLDALRDDPDARVLLVHYFTPSDIERTRPARAVQQLETIRRAFGGRADILLINAPFPAERVMHLRIDETQEGEGPWQGDTALWASRLDTLGIRYVGADLAPPGHAIRPAHESMNRARAVA
jgi:hypothetical protein